MPLSSTQTSRERASGNAERHRWPEMRLRQSVPASVLAGGRGLNAPGGHCLVPGAGQRSRR